jgi:hypothetical protein
VQANLRAKRESGGHIARPYALAHPEVGDRAGHTQNPMLAACAKQALCGRRAHDLLTRVVEPRVQVQQADVHLRVYRGRIASESCGLALARKRYAVAGGTGARQRLCAEVVRAGTMKVNEQVDAIEQRTAQPAPVSGELCFAAAASVLLACVSARAGIGGGDQHEPGRVHLRALRAHDRHPPVLYRLAQRLERGS